MDENTRHIIASNLAGVYFQFNMPAISARNMQSNPRHRPTDDIVSMDDVIKTYHALVSHLISWEQQQKLIESKQQKL